MRTRSSYITRDAMRPGDRDAQAARDRGDDDRQRARRSRDDRASTVQSSGVMPSSMPDLAEERAGLEHERLDHDEHDRERQQPPVRAQHPAQA